MNAGKTLLMVFVFFLVFDEIFTQRVLKAPQSQASKSKDKPNQIKDSKGSETETKKQTLNKVDSKDAKETGKNEDTTQDKDNDENDDDDDDNKTNADKNTNAANDDGDDDDDDDNNQSGSNSNSKNAKQAQKSTTKVAKTNKNSKSTNNKNKNQASGESDKSTNNASKTKAKNENKQDGDNKNNKNNNNNDDNDDDDDDDNDKKNDADKNSTDDKDETSTDAPSDDTTTANPNDSDDNDKSSEANQNCSRPSIKEFPEDLFSQRQRRFGAVLLHVAFAAYLFVAITMVCDQYFMSSLEIIGKNLNLDQDVAGATFMAAGSSAPEVFISLIGIFFAESNPSIGAIVGSAIFNILFVIGLCGLFILGTAKLTIWPFFRDSVFYCVAILLLVLLIRDNRVYWYESLVLLLFYGLYIFFMMNNDRLKNLAYEKFKILQQETDSILPENSSKAPHNKEYGFISKRSISGSQSGYNKFNDEDEMYAWGGTLDNIVGQTENANVSYQNSSGGNIKPDQAAIKNETEDPIRNADGLVASDNRHFDLNPLNRRNYGLFLTDIPNLNEQYGFLKFMKWVVFLPVKILFYFTMPDCRVEKYQKWYIITFVVSIIWLAVLSYLIIWMITIIGYTLGIPDSLMAVTFIAAGTSIPDAYTSVIVVKEGMVDMGVSNIIGSNVFDLLIGLAFPWFIKSIFNSGYVTINSNGLVYDSLLLYACVLATICVIHIRKWNLDRRTGYLFLSIYAAFIIFSAAIELNMFSDVNPRMCD